MATAGTRLSTHNWRSAASGNLGGWQVARCLFLLNALIGAIATEGGTFPNAWNKYVPRPMYMPPHPEKWNELTWPSEYPFTMFELSFLLPHLLKDDRGRVDVYFTRVYNPVWTNPDGFTWIEALTDEKKVGLHVALTPTWNETAFYADYVLPMGLGSERHDLHSYEQYDGRWIGFRQPVLRVARERLNQPVTDTRQANPGEVWEENEFWIELSWRIDPDGSLAFASISSHRRIRAANSRSMSTTAGSSRTRCRVCRSRRSRRSDATRVHAAHGVFEIEKRIGSLYEQQVPDAELDDVQVDRFGRVYTKAARPAPLNIVPQPTPDGDAEGRRPVGVLLDNKVVRGFPTPSGKLEFYSRTLVDWGWPEYAIPTYIKSHVHPDNMEADQIALISTFRLPVQIHTRSGNAKWLDEIAHTNPLWIHTDDAERAALRTGDLVRVETEIGYFVVKAWVTEGIRPGVVACSHHMGRWRTGGEGQRQVMATVNLDHKGTPGNAPAQWREAVRIRRSRHAAHLVERCGRASEHHVPGASRSHLGNALLASGRAREKSRVRRSLRRHQRRYQQVARGIPEVARADAARANGLTRWHAPALLAAATVETGTRGVQVAVIVPIKRSLTCWRSDRGTRKSCTS